MNKEGKRKNPDSDKSSDIDVIHIKFKKKLQEAWLLMRKMEHGNKACLMMH